VQKEEEAAVTAESGAFSTLKIIDVLPLGCRSESLHKIFIVGLSAKNQKRFNLESDIPPAQVYLGGIFAF
jgi:hypothetical protein